MSAGYSGTPLQKKLGIKPGTHLTALSAPSDYRSLLSELPEGAAISTRLTTATAMVHLFVTKRQDLAKHLTSLRTKVRDDVPVWVSWPKKTSGVPSTVTEDVIREVALPLGFVDIKVCAVSEIWSGLKLVIRKELRSRPG